MIREAAQKVICRSLFLWWVLGMLTATARAERFSTLAGAVDAMTSKYKVHFGVEYSPKDADKQAIELDLTPARVEPVLNQLVTEKPDYAWAVNDGVYNLYPKSNAKSLLNLRVRTFTIRQLSLARASEELIRIPEVADWLARQNVSRREFEVGGPNHCTDVQASLTLHRVTLRDVLNSMVKASRCGNWTVVRYGNNLEFVGIYFR